MVFQVILWIPITILLASPFVLYAISTAVPGDNILHLNEKLLKYVHMTAGAVLYIINAFFVPVLANAISQHANHGVRDRAAALKLMMSSRLIISLVVPFCSLFVLKQASPPQQMWV